GSLLTERGPAGMTDYLWLGGTLVGMVRNNVLYAIHTDHLGRPEMVTNPTQAIVWRANNYAFHRDVAQDNIGGLNLGFPGQYFDAETGLWNNGFRDYDSSMGVYVESDPIGLAGGINTYAYVGGNPGNRADFLGLCPIDCNTKLPDGKTVGDYVRKYYAEMQSALNAEMSGMANANDQMIGNGATFATEAIFFNIFKSNGPIDFKNTFRGRGDATQLGQAGNFAYYAIGVGALTAQELDMGAGAYAILSAIKGQKSFSSLGGPMGSDLSAKSVRNAALAANGCQ
ncbi:MAG: hypothetical protein JSS45_00210, partial [Proteobacteria bacterium]|nr:hypothetical protein [Pseudomonadota bacterium]